MNDSGNPISECKTRFQLQRDLTRATLDFGLTPGGQLYLCLLYQLHELSYRRDAQLMHQSPAVDFDGFLRHAKLAADLLI